MAFLFWFIPGKHTTSKAGLLRGSQRYCPLRHPLRHLPLQNSWSVERSAVASRCVLRPAAHRDAARLSLFCSVSEQTRTEEFSLQSCCSQIPAGASTFKLPPSPSSSTHFLCKCTPLGGDRRCLVKIKKKYTLPRFQLAVVNIVNKHISEYYFLFSTMILLLLWHLHWGRTLGTSWAASGAWRENPNL